jgi:hypothetical protein
MAEKRAELRTSLFRSLYGFAALTLFMVFKAVDIVPMFWFGSIDKIDSIEELVFALPVLILGLAGTSWVLWIAVSGLITTAELAKLGGTVGEVLPKKLLLSLVLFGAIAGYCVIGGFAVLLF